MFFPFLLGRTIGIMLEAMWLERYFLAHHWLDVIAGYAEGCAVSLLAAKATESSERNSNPLCLRR